MKSVPSNLRTIEFTSPVGSWRLHAWVPSPDLAHAVEQLWAVDSSTREFQEKVLPRRTVELTINLGESHEILREGGDAYRCGYYDQAHFNRDFRLFTGAMPGEFPAARDPSGQAMLVEQGQHFSKTNSRRLC